MSSPSNLYAEKIFAEHPTALWALDDQADYISLISESQRDISSSWSVTNGVASEDTELIKYPFENSFITKIDGDVPLVDSQEITCISSNIINFTDLNSDFGSFTVGSYFYVNSLLLESISIGYEYTDTTTSLIVQKFKDFSISVTNNWIFISETFDIPNENTNLRIVIKVNAVAGGSSEDYVFYLNGLTLGQWSEQHNAESLGIEKELLPTNIFMYTPDTYGVPASQYGIEEDVGYYIVKNNALVARNCSIPMTFGATGITSLLPNSGETNKPSLIVPGKGFLNKSGQFKEYTIEFWIRINTSSYLPKRIFGPVGSSDGLYVESGFLTLKIGNVFGSYFVGEWFRPMLVHIRVIRNNSTLLINGEEVINLTINTDSLDLPNLLDENDKDQDWLGFYAYSDISPIEIDAFAIYSYQVPIPVAKRRWVYGQGVLSPEGINSAYGGVSAFVDYSLAKYSANYNYPDFAKWEQGSFDNLSSNSLSISTPSYSLPEIFTDEKSLQDLYNDNKEIQDEEFNFITFRPNEDWNGQDTYFNFNSFNILNDQIHTIYGVFSSESLDTEQTLFKIYNEITGNSFSIRKDMNEIHYYMNYNGVEEEIYTTVPILVDEKFAAGIQIEPLSNYFGGNVSSFFGNQNGLKIYVGWDNDGDYQFTGKIYTVGLSSNLNAQNILDHFETNGIAILDDLSDPEVESPVNAIALINHTASYTILPIQAYDNYFLDIGVSGYWEDYIPLTYFAKYITNDVGNQYYDLDFLQFNIGYPATSSIQEYETTEPWTYQDLDSQFDHPVQRTYSQLDNFLYTTWSNYEDMSERSIKYFEYDTSNAMIKSYFSIQYITEGANKPSSDFTTIESAKQDSIIKLSDYPNWDVTKFELVDNTLIYPDKKVDFNDLALVTHLEFNVRGILSKPISLKRLEIASQSLNDNSFNPIGTRFAVNLFPYKKAGIYYDYKSDNPFSIYKGSTPYLYMNRRSGIEPRGSYDPLVDRGISMPVNQNLSQNFRISALQMWMRYDKDQFPGTPIELFKVKYKADTIIFYLVANSNSGKRAKVFAKSETTGLDYNGLSYYINGNLVREPVLTTKVWDVLGIAFSDALVFDSFLGSINLNAPIVFNNVAYYRATDLQQVQNISFRPWLKVKTDGVTDFAWEYWFNNFIWNEMLVISATDFYGVSPADIYKTYLGTNKIICDDGQGMSIDMDKLKVFGSTTWTSRTETPV